MPTSDAFSPALALTLAFAAALTLGLVLKFWLATRQIRHVARHRSDVPAPFAERIALAAHQKAADYTITKARLGLLEMALGAAVLLGWTLLGGLDVLNQALLSALGGGMWQQLALLTAFAAISGLIDLPLSLYQTFVVEERFGFNKMTWRLWLADALKGLLVGALIGLPIAALILWIMAATGPLWWLWAWCFWMGFNLLLMVVYPTFIAPLFNKFQPLEDESLKARVTALMQRCGFSAKGLFVMDGSRRSAHANAYFTGFGAAKRVVFYDTLLRQLAPGEVEAVLLLEPTGEATAGARWRFGSNTLSAAFGLEAAFAMGPASIQGEYITRKTKADDNAFDDIKGHGFYVQGAYTLTGESRGYKVGKFDAIKPQNKSIGAWEVFYRYDSLTVEDDNITTATLTRDVGDAEAKVHTLGVNWYANEAVKISAAYLNAKTEKVTNATAASGGTPAQRTGDDSGDGFVVRAQYVF